MAREAPFHNSQEPVLTGFEHRDGIIGRFIQFWRFLQHPRCPPRMKRAFKYDAAISATEFDALGVGELSRRLQHRVGKTVYATPRNGEKPQTAVTLAAAKKVIEKEVARRRRPVSAALGNRSDRSRLRRAQNADRKAQAEGRDRRSARQRSDSRLAQGNRRPRLGRAGEQRRGRRDRHGRRGGGRRVEAPNRRRRRRSCGRRRQARQSAHRRFLRHSGRSR